MSDDKHRVFELESKLRTAEANLAGEKSKRQSEKFQADQQIAQLQRENATLKRKLRDHGIS